MSIHTDLNERTRGLIGEDELGRMKDGAILINAARGGIVEGRNKLFIARHHVVDLVPILLVCLSGLVD
eukprot:COSAG06_NODE_27744_length_587_cov_0.934426_1_plen_67_part_01